MYRLVRCTLTALSLALPAALLAQSRSVSPITTAEIDGYLRFLSSDLLEGRAPAWLEPVEIGGPPALKVWRIAP